MNRPTARTSISHNNYLTVIYAIQKIYYREGSDINNCLTSRDYLITGKGVILHLRSFHNV